MKGKQLRKALALIGGFVGSAAMATGPAYATWSFATTASNTGTASVSVGGEIDTPSISASGGWLNQTVLFENNDDYIDGTLHYSGYTSGSAGVTAIQGPDNTYSIALGHVGAATYSYSAYMTSPNAWPSQTATQTFSMPAPNNNMTCSITSPTGHYHVGETVSFTYTYTEATYPTVLAGIQSSVNANFIWTTDSTATSGGWNWSLNMFTHSGTTWTHTDINTISANATYYIRCQIKDGITGLYSAWKTIATVSPVEAAADITTSQQPAMIAWNFVKPVFLGAFLQSVGFLLLHGLWLLLHLLLLLDDEFETSDADRWICRNEQWRVAQNRFDEFKLRDREPHQFVPNLLLVGLGGMQSDENQHLFKRQERNRVSQRGCGGPELHSRPK
jgi:hypothetical protein